MKSELKLPDTAQCYLAQAHVCFERRNFEEARDNLRAALAFEPQNPHLLMALGHVEFGLGMYGMAVERYAAVAEIHPEAAPAWACRALAHVFQQQHREADNAARQALELDESNMVALKVLARLGLDRGNHEKARGYCRRILNLNPLDGEALQLLDQCRFPMEELLDRPEPVATEAAAPAWMHVHTVNPKTSHATILPFPQ